MRETTRSLRAYLAIVGALSGVRYFMTIVGSDNIVLTLISVVGLGLAAGYLYLAVKLKHLLVASPQQISYVLLAGAIFLGMLLVLNLLSGLTTGALIYVIVGLLITWYLFKNAKRLAKEASETEPQPPQTVA